MPLRLISHIMVLMGLSMSLAVANLSPPPCSMRPAHLQIRLPRHGFTWLDGEAISGKCDDVPAQRWMRTSSGPIDLFVYADGPSGSGHYWNVTIGVALKRQSQPIRGVCLTTSTVGWRTLQQFKNAPLAWLDDLDKDGKPELILWSSFPLREDASLAEYGLMAWVYRLDSENSLTVDWSLSRRMAREIAGAYRSSLEPAMSYAGPLRIEAAHSLERFADQPCGQVSGSPTAVKSAMAESNRERLEKLKQAIDEEIGEPRAESIGQCKYIPFGAKPCGGPWTYLVYSTARTDEAKLQGLVKEYNALQKKINAEEHLLSDCSVPAAPELVLENGVCAAKRR